MSGGRQLENEIYISSGNMYRIFQLERCIILIWRQPDICGGNHLENEMYIASGKMYISTGEMCFQVHLTS